MDKYVKIRQLILQIALIIGILSVIIFAGLLIRELMIDNQSRLFYSNLLAGIETNPREPSGQHGEAGSSQPGTNGTQENPPPISDPNWVPYVDFAALDATFPGIRGWIKLFGSSLDYPVMQYTDNSFFLSHLPDGTRHRSGSIFLDYRNSSDFSDKSILIYGHESKEGELFGSLKNYRNQEFFNENPVIYLYTPEADYEIVIFAAHLAHSQRDHPPLHFTDDNEFLSYIEQIKSISLIKSDVVITAADQIVSLCTCAYDFDDARLVVVGVLVPERG
ncbi:MAG: class B sortase [Oscillospiraceae bacterium]|nr:class B sortase [Oscillospiraceae bacterium]